MMFKKNWFLGLVLCVFSSVNAMEQQEESKDNNSEKALLKNNIIFCTLKKNHVIVARDDSIALWDNKLTLKCTIPADNIFPVIGLSLKLGLLAFIEQKCPNIVELYNIKEQRPHSSVWRTSGGNVTDIVFAIKNEQIFVSSDLPSLLVWNIPEKGIQNCALNIELLPQRMGENDVQFNYDFNSKHGVMVWGYLEKIDEKGNKKYIIDNKRFKIGRDLKPSYHGLKLPSLKLDHAVDFKLFFHSFNNIKKDKNDLREKMERAITIDGQGIIENWNLEKRYNYKPKWTIKNEGISITPFHFRDKNSIDIVKFNKNKKDEYNLIYVLYKWGESILAIDEETGNQIGNYDLQRSSFCKNIKHYTFDLRDRLGFIKAKLKNNIFKIILFGDADIDPQYYIRKIVGEGNVVVINNNLLQKELMIALSRNNFLQNKKHVENIIKSPKDGCSCNLI